MLTIAHRGASGYELENSLASFRRALELEADMVELDVHTCKTGELVVMHDEDIERTAEGKGKIAKMSLIQIKSFKMKNGEEIPLLSEVLDLIGGKMGVNIELKGKETAEPCFYLISDYLSKGWEKKDFVVSSFDYLELQNLHELDPEIRIGFLSKDEPESFEEMEQIGAYSVHVGHRGLPLAYVTEAHVRGLKVFCWTVNNLKDVKRLESFGVDGIITDYPGKISSKIKV